MQCERTMMVRQRQAVTEQKIPRCLLDLAPRLSGEVSLYFWLFVLVNKYYNALSITLKT